MSQCLLCVHAGGGKEEMSEIFSYITDCCGVVHEDEIARQVAQVCGGMDPPVVLDAAQVKRHMQEHMLDQRVVMVNVLRDLLTVSSATRRLALFEGVAASERNVLRPGEEEDVMSEAESEARQGHPILDSKAMAVYLKTIDQITGIYKLPSMARLNGAAAAAPK